MMRCEDILLPWESAHNKKPFKSRRTIWGISQQTWNRILEDTISHMKFSTYQPAYDTPIPCYFIQTRENGNWFIPKECVNSTLNVDKRLMMQRRSNLY